MVLGERKRESPGSHPAVHGFRLPALEHGVHLLMMLCDGYLIKDLTGPLPDWHPKKKTGSASISLVVSTARQEQGCLEERQRRGEERQPSPSYALKSR